MMHNTLGTVTLAVQGETVVGSRHMALGGRGPLSQKSSAPCNHSTHTRGGVGMVIDLDCDGRCTVMDATQLAEEDFRVDEAQIIHDA